MNVGVLGKGGKIGVQNRKIRIVKEVEVREIGYQIKHQVVQIKHQAVIIDQAEMKRMMKMTIPK